MKPFQLEVYLCQFEKNLKLLYLELESTLKIFFFLGKGKWFGYAKFNKKGYIEHSKTE